MSSWLTISSARGRSDPGPKWPSARWGWLGVLVLCWVGLSGCREFGLVTLALDVERPGDGRVRSQPAGLDCVDSCSSRFVSGSSVTLQALSGGGRPFVGWGGDCEGQSHMIRVPLDRSIRCRAVFRRLFGRFFGLPEAFWEELGVADSDWPAWMTERPAPLPVGVAPYPGGGALVIANHELPVVAGVLDQPLNDVRLVRLGRAGTVERSWRMRQREQALRVLGTASTADGGLVAVGLWGAAGWILRIDARGDVVWQRRLESSGSLALWDVRAVSAGGFLVAGTESETDSGAYVGWFAEIDDGGQLLWQRRVTGAGDTVLQGIVPTRAGALLVGWRRSAGGQGYGLWLLAVDVDGEVLWQQLRGGTVGSRAQLAAAPDGGVLVASSRQQSGAVSTDVWLLRLDPDGSVRWEQMLVSARRDEVAAVSATADGDWLLAGTTRYFDLPGPEGWLVRLADDGSLRWQRRYGGLYEDELSAVAEATDGGLLVAGRHKRVPLDQQGELLLRPGFWVLELDREGWLFDSCRDQVGGPVDAVVQPVTTAVISGRVVLGTGRVTLVDALLEPMDASLEQGSVCR